MPTEQPAERPTTQYEVEIAPDRVAVLRELTAAEFEGVFKALTSSDNQAWELTQRGLRLSLVRDGADELEYKDLVGGKLAQRFTTRQMLMLRSAWEQIHLPTAEDQARVRGMRAVVS